MLAHSCSSFHCSSGGRLWSPARRRDNLPTLSQTSAPESWSQTQCGRGERSSRAPGSGSWWTKSVLIHQNSKGMWWDCISYRKCSNHKPNGIHPSYDALPGNQRLAERWKKTLCDSSIIQTLISPEHTSKKYHKNHMMLKILKSEPLTA